MTDTQDLNQDGLTRRRLLMRGAVAGGVVWAAPAITTVGGAAFAASPGDQDISFVAILADCGGTTYRFKFEAPFAAGSISPSECGPSFAVDGCADQLSKDSASVSNSCPAGVTATFNGDGSLTVHLGTCTLLDFVVKCGVPSDPADQGCEDTDQVTQPTVGATGDVTFLPCTIEP